MGTKNAEIESITESNRLLMHKIDYLQMENAQLRERVKALHSELSLTKEHETDLMQSIDLMYEQIEIFKDRYKSMKVLYTEFYIKMEDFLSR